MFRKEVGIVWITPRGILLLLSLIFFRVKHVPSGFFLLLKN